MNDQPVTTLRKLIRQYGDDLVTDARRTEALLNDFCPEYRREVFVLVNAQRQQVPEELMATPKWMPSDAAAARLSRRLQQRLGLSEEAADWAVRSWSVALGLQHNPSTAAKMLDWARVSIRRPRDHAQAAPPQGQSTRVDVQSSAGPATSHGKSSPVDGASNAVHGGVNVSGKARGSSLAQATKVGANPYSVVDAKHGSHVYLRNLAGVAAAALSLVLLWFVVVSTPARESVAPLVALVRSPAQAVQDAYPLPRTAWVSDGPLLVRSGPSVAEESSTMLPAGESVRVSELSPDLHWSHIVEPVEGWVSNWYLNFVFEEESTTTVRMLRQELIAAYDNVPVYALPNAQADTVTTLPAGQDVVTIAATTDGLWRHISRPVVGWVPSDGLVIQD